jgi:galactokinase/mevalonate kinase-like predicted kinase
MESLMVKASNHGPMAGNTMGCGNKGSLLVKVKKYILMDAQKKATGKMELSLNKEDKVRFRCSFINLGEISRNFGGIGGFKS